MTLSLLLVAVSCYINQTQLKPDGIGCSQADAVLHAIEVEFPNCDFSIVCLAILAQVQLQATAQLAALYTASFRTYRLQMSQTATSMGLHGLEEYVSCCLPKLPVVRLCSVQPNQPGSESEFDLHIPRILTGRSIFKLCFTSLKNPMNSGPSGPMVQDSLGCDFIL